MYRASLLRIFRAQLLVASSCGFWDEIECRARLQESVRHEFASTPRERWSEISGGASSSSSPPKKRECGLRPRELVRGWWSGPAWPFVAFRPGRPATVSRATDPTLLKLQYPAPADRSRDCKFECKRESPISSERVRSERLREREGELSRELDKANQHKKSLRASKQSGLT